MKRNKILIALIPLLIISGLIFKSCTEENNNEPICSISGNVVGYNPDKCGCCPGWLISDGVDTLKFETVPNNDLLWDLVNFYGYPVPITFNYSDREGSCSDFYKEITCIEFNLDMNCLKSGQIIDYNGTECMCCPGWIIKIGQDTIKVLNLPIESQVREIVETSGFPISIELDYEDISGTCEEFYKQITCIKLDD